MQQAFTCSKGHHWSADAESASDDQIGVSHCPECGEAKQASVPQELSLGGSETAAGGGEVRDTTAFQDLEKQRRANEPQFSLLPETTAFQDLSAEREAAPTRSRSRTENTNFQQIPVRSIDKPGSATAPPGSTTPSAAEQSTAVTARFEGRRREALQKTWPALPGYEIIAEIGRSATSIVFQARDSNLQRVVAIKVLTAGEYGSSKHTSWLRAELETVARLEHPCVAQIYETGEHAGRFYIVMAYVDGGNLEQKIRGKPQAPVAAAQLVETLARTLTYVHEQKLIHRNLKPSNVLLGSDGVPQITDFAMARAADRSSILNPEGMIGGDPSYMAPEHLERDQSAGNMQRGATPATDIYALGTILFHILTGRPPFLGATPADTVELAQEQDPITPGQLQLKVPETLEIICEKCLQKAPAARYASALELAEDLHAYLVGDRIKAQAAGAAARVWKWIAQRPFLVGSAAMLLAAYSYLTIALINQRSVLLEDLHAAGTQKAAAEKRLDDTRRALFLADMGMAEEAWRQADRDTAVKLLEKHRKEDDLRSFEWAYLWRLCHSDRLRLSAGRVHALAFSSDGRALATAGEAVGAKSADSGEIHLYDATTGESWAKLAAAGVPVLAVAFAPAGRTLVTGDARGRIQFWDALTGKPQRAFSGHTGEVHALAFTADGKTLASGGADGIVKLWDPLTGNEQGSLPGHPGALTCVAFSSDGKLLAAGCQGQPERKAGEIRLWDWSKRTQRAILQGHHGPVSTVAFAPDATTLLSGGGISGQAGELKLWDVSAGRLKADLPGCLDRVVSLAYAADGKTVAVGGDDGLIQLWHMASMPSLQLVLRGHDGPITAIAIASDSDTLASAGADNTVKVWSIAQASGGATLADTKLPITMPVNGLAFAKHGNVPVLATVGGEAGQAGEVKVWDTARGQLLGAVDRGLDRAVLATAFSADGKMLATAGEDTTAKVWDWTGGKLITTLKGHSHWVTCVAFAPRGGVVATGGADSTVRLWQPETGREAGTLTGHVQRIAALAFSPDGTLLVSADESHVVCIWQVASQREVKRITGHTGAVLGVAFSPDGKTLATAGADRTVRLWDVETGTERAVLRGHAYAVTSVAFTPDGKCLASGSRDTTIRLWDLISGQPRAVLRGHADWVTSIAFSPNGKTLASASLDKTVKLWQAGD